MAKIESVTDNVYRFWCLGCKEWHTFPTNGKRLQNGATWHFNGDMENPTISPSLNISWERTEEGYSYRCHSVVTDGRIFFCTDSTHELSGLTVELPDTAALK